MTLNTGLESLMTLMKATGFLPHHKNPFLITVGLQGNLTMPIPIKTARTSSTWTAIGKTKIVA